MAVIGNLNYFDLWLKGWQRPGTLHSCGPSGTREKCSFSALDSPARTIGADWRHAGALERSLRADQHEVRHEFALGYSTRPLQQDFLPEILGQPLEPARTDPEAYYQDKSRELLDDAIARHMPILLVIDGLDEALGKSFDVSWFPRRARSFITSTGFGSA